MTELAEFAKTGAANIDEITESAARAMYLILSLVPLRSYMEQHALRPKIVPVVLVGVRVLDAMHELRPTISDDLRLARLGTSLRAMSFWLSAICGAWDIERARAEGLLRSALSWPSVYPPLESVLLNTLLADNGTFELQLSDRELRHTVARYLSLPVFASDVEAMFEQAHRSKNAAKYGGATTLFRAAGSHAPDRIDALLGQVISLLRAAVNEFHMRAVSLDEVAEALRLLGLALLDQHLVDLWRRRDLHRWEAVWQQSGTVFAKDESQTEITSSDVFDSGLGDPFKGPSQAPIHDARVEVDPQMLVSDALARTYMLDEYQLHPDQVGDPYSVLPTERAWVPNEWTKDWALLQLRDFLSGSSASQPDLEKSLSDLADGLKALYRRMDVGFELAAKELSLGRLGTDLTDVYTTARDAAIEELQKRLGSAWPRIREPIRGQLLESETQFQLQGRTRLGSQNLIALGYAGVLEAWIRAHLRSNITPRQTLASVAAALRRCAQYESAFEARSEEDRDLWRVTQRDREFWWKEVPGVLLDDGVSTWRNAVAHTAASPGWRRIESLRVRMLGEADMPGLLARTPERTA
jgi:hypothetical protein